MSKPTIIQTLLNRPSQTYLKLESPQKEYYSAKPELLRIAAETGHYDGKRWSNIPGDSDLDLHDFHHSHSNSSLPPERSATTTMPMASPPQVRRDQPPRAASATVAAAIQQRQPTISSVVASGSQNPYPQSRQQRSASGPSGRARSPLTKPKNSILDDDSDDLDGFDSSDDDNPDVFFTPNQSPRTSLASSSILFPRHARNTSPRQASRKSLRTSNASSYVQVSAPGISASNSGGSIKPTPGHVGNEPSSSSGGTATTAAPTPMAQPQHKQSTQQRASYTNHAQPASTSNGSTPTRKPVPSAIPQGSTTPKGSTQQLPSRKPSVPASETLTPTRAAAAQEVRSSHPASSSAPIPPRTRTNSIKTSTPETTVKLVVKGPSNTPIKSSTASSASPNSSFNTNSSSNATPPVSSSLGASTSSSSSHAQQQQRASGTKATPPRPTPKLPVLSNQSSSNSLSSTTLENHSDIFTVLSGSDLVSHSTAMTTPANSGSSAGGAFAALKKASSPQSNGAPPIPPPMRSHSLRSTRTPLPAKPRNLAAKPPIPVNPSANGNLHQRYSYTDDDWKREVRSLVDLNRALEESLNEEERVANSAAALNRNASVASTSKKDDQRKSSGHGHTETRDMHTSAATPASPTAADKGKAKEKDGKDTKSKKKKTGSVEREVVYYTAKHGTPRPPPDTAVNGATNGIGSSTTKSYPSPTPASQPPLPPKVPAGGRNGYGHLQPSLMMNMRVLMEDDDVSDGRLSVVTEKDEPPTPTVPTHSILGGPLTKEPHTTSVFNAFAPLRPTASNAAPVDMIRRRSRSMGEQDLEDQQKPRMSSVASWADEYKDILARSRGQAMASGTSLLSSPSQHSFAYRSAVPVPSGELPSNGTPGYTPLHLARAPPGTYVQDGEVHSRLPGTPPTPGFLGAVLSPQGAPGMQSPNGRVDLTLSGAAQTTMASVEVIKGLGSVKRGLSGVFGLASLGRRRTVSGGEGMDLLQNRRPNRLRKGSEDLHGSGTLDPTGARVSVTPGGGADRVLGFTGYRHPPSYVPRNSVLVQVWAVGVDGVDARVVGLRLGKRKAGPDFEEDPEVQPPRSQFQEGSSKDANGKEGDHVPPKKLGRSASLRARLGSLSRRKGSISMKGGWSSDAEDGGTGKLRKSKGKSKELPPPPASYAEVGFIPGRSFVGRVLDCGWDVKDEHVRRGDWVIGHLETRKCGALTQFIVVDRHRVHRVPYPSTMNPPDPTASTTSATTTGMMSSSSGSSSRTARPVPQQSLTLEEFALLPLCAIPAYRAVQTFTSAFDGPGLNSTRPPPRSPVSMDESKKLRALVLHGHTGVGAMVVRMLAHLNWRISVHVPVPGRHEEHRPFMADAEERVRDLGGEEVIFDDGGLPGDPWWDDGRAAAVRVINGLKEDGDVFDAILDTLGGREIREASERLLKSHGLDADTAGKGAIDQLDEGSPVNKGLKKHSHGQFTTLVGEWPERVIPTTADNFRAGLRAIKINGGAANGPAGAREEKTRVGYAWINVTQDVDWEGQDIAANLGTALRLALEHNIRPVVQRARTQDEYSPEYHWQSGVIPFENTPEAFVNGDGPLSSGGTLVVKVVN